MSKRSLFRKRAIRVKYSLNQGRTPRARLIVNRSHSHIYAQLVAVDGHVIASSNSLQLKKSQLKGRELAKKVGEELARKALKVKKTKTLNVVFDRRGYAYHGLIKAVAEGAKKGHLVF